MASPIPMELLTPIYRSIQSYRAATNRVPAAIVFAPGVVGGEPTAIYGILAYIDLKLEPGAIDVIDSDGWAVGRLWDDGTTRP